MNHEMTVQNIQDETEKEDESRVRWRLVLTLNSKTLQIRTCHIYVNVRFDLHSSVF